VTFDLTAAPHVSLNGGLALADAVLSTALGAVYFVGAWRRYEGSPGARLLGMRVVRADGGGRVGWGSGLVRWLFIGLPLALEALASANAKAEEVVGRVQLSVSQGAVPHVLEPVVPVFRQRYPRISLEVVIEERVAVDFVAEGYDAAFQVTEVIARDMVRVRLTDPFKYFVVGSPAYFAKHGTPRKPEDLLQHECITFRWPTGAALYAWELERGRRKWRVPVRGGLVTNHLQFCITMAEAGLGLAYIADLSIKDQLSDGRLVAVLQSYSPTEPGLFLCYPSRTQCSPALRLFIETTKEVLRQK